ncbi:hypothetical protein XENORESO_013299 [Xenotaenia resolanae]|uniref:Uncharacterized protein n=1 Tax=Xenotaenia resolanae TaxID=208358 RepID=A0ABV0WKQ9_9TELE
MFKPFSIQKELSSKSSLNKNPVQPPHQRRVTFCRSIWFPLITCKRLLIERSELLLLAVNQSYSLRVFIQKKETEVNKDSSSKHLFPWKHEVPFYLTLSAQILF